MHDFPLFYLKGMPSLQVCISPSIFFLTQRKPKSIKISQTFFRSSVQQIEAPNFLSVLPLDCEQIAFKLSSVHFTLTCNGDPLNDSFPSYLHSPRFRT